MRRKFVSLLLGCVLIFGCFSVNAFADSCPRGGPHYYSHEVQEYTYSVSAGSHMHLTAFVGGQNRYEKCEMSNVYAVCTYECVKCNGKTSDTHTKYLYTAHSK